MKLNEAVVKALAVPAKGAKLYGFAGAVIQGSAAPRGFSIKVTAGGVRSFALRYWCPAERLIVIGQYPDWNPAAAVRRARELRQQIDGGQDPLAERRKADAAARDTLQAICEEFFRRDGADLRTKADRENDLKRLAWPVLGNRAIEDIKRSDIIRLLDKVTDESGPVMADRLLAYIRRVMNWHASRSDDYRSPIVRGMARTKPKERARERTLTDAELKAVWRACEASPGPFARMVQFILLTGARRTEASAMPWTELDAGDWILPAARNKAKVELLRPLSPAAVAVFPAKIADCKYVFSTDGINPISGFSKFKAALNKASGTSGWTLHDCRRTARTLLSRAGVDPDIAEQCLGHVIGGVRGIYDGHEYADEKAKAYEALAALVDRITNPPAGDVVALDRHRSRRQAKA
jgi:integrase